MELSSLSQEELRLLQSLILISVLTLPLKGLALWKASQQRQKVWFGLLLVVNTMGILDVIYYFFVGARPKSKQTHKES